MLLAVSVIGIGASRLFELFGLELLGRVTGFTIRASDRAREEIVRFRTEGRSVERDVAQFSAAQQAKNPLNPHRATVFMIITCGQAVRNFVLSDFLGLLRSRFNVVILTPYAYSEGFQTEYALPGVHVLPWFKSFRSILERAFQYYFMSKSRSRTHHSWLANLEARAKDDTENRSRFRRLILMRRTSDLLGAVVGRRGMQGLYGSYFLAYLPKALFSFLFSTYRPALVISTTAHHAEAWPLTYFARRNNVKTLANILSWDNPTTKPVMDASCDYYSVWSEEMKRELAEQFPHLKTKVIITGCPLFDVYYQRPYAMPREEFLTKMGLADKPYILYATNTPAAMPDECEVIKQYWEALGRSQLAGKISMLVRLHPKETIEKYKPLLGLKDVVVTLAAKPHWDQSDRWLPSHEDMCLLLNSMLHAAVSVNVASTMSLESFALSLPTINIGFKSSPEIKDQGSMWSFDMYHFSEHYHAIVDNGAVDLARSVGELVDFTIKALADPARHSDAMRKTLEQKAAYCDGTSARRFFEVVEDIIEARERPQRADERSAPRTPPVLASPVEKIRAAE